MTKRLPRKLKKKAVQKVNALIAMRMVMVAMVVGQTSAQIAIISSQPRRQDIPQPSWLAQRAIEVAKVTVESHRSISNIVDQKPNSWRDFIK